MKEVHPTAEQNTTKFPCSICESKFSRKEKLRQHLVKVHQIFEAGSLQAITITGDVMQGGELQVEGFQGEVLKVERIQAKVEEQFRLVIPSQPNFSYSGKNLNGSLSLQEEELPTNTHLMELL